MQNRRLRESLFSTPERTVEGHHCSTATTIAVFFAMLLQRPSPRMACGRSCNAGRAVVCNPAPGPAVRINPMPLERRIQALCDAIIACQDKERAVILAEQLQVVLHERIDQIHGRRMVDKQGPLG